jgi:hypothetical protein
MASEPMTTKHKLIYGGSAAFGLIMSIISFSSCLSAQRALDANADAYDFVVKNWQAKPLLDAKVVAKNADCPAGYGVGKAWATEKNKYEASKSALSLQEIGVWSGTHEWCECRSNSKANTGTGTDTTVVPATWRYHTVQYKKITGCSGMSTDTKVSCTSPSNAITGCTQQQKAAGCTSKYATSWSTKYQLFGKTCAGNTCKGKCTTNATSAGCKTVTAKQPVELKAFKSKTICYKRGGLSTIERPAAIDGKCADGIECANARDVGAICAKTQEDCPATTLKAVASASGDSISDLDKKERPIIEVRMTLGPMCQKGVEGYAGYTVSNDVANDRLKHRPDKTCDAVDPRYVTFDEQFDKDVLQDNGLLATEPTLSLTVPSEQSTAISYTTGTKQQTEYKWHLSFRRELLWKANCTAGSPQSLSKNLSPIQDIQSAQATLTALNGVFGLFILGIVFPLTVLMKVFDKDNDLPCIPGEGAEEEKNIKKYKSVCGVVAKIAKFTPLLLSLSISTRVKDFFEAVGKAECSDPTTNVIFSELGTQVAKVDAANHQTLIVDCVMVVGSILSWLWQWHKSHKSKEGKDTEMVSDA